MFKIGVLVFVGILMSLLLASLLFVANNYLVDIYPLRWAQCFGIVCILLVVKSIFYSEVKVSKS